MATLTLTLGTFGDLAQLAGLAERADLEPAASDAGRLAVPGRGAAAGRAARRPLEEIVVRRRIQARARLALVPMADPFAADGSLDGLADEELVLRAREDRANAGRYLDALYERFYPRVAHWCLRVCGSSQEAGDLAQEVFLRVHERLDSFRLESRFSTWLYVLTRRVAINRGIAERRRATEDLEGIEGEEGTWALPEAHETLERAESVRALRRAIAEALDEEERRVLYLHFVAGMTLPAVTELLELDNRSGAKAYVVSAKRKLKRYFHRDSLESMGDDSRTEEARES